MASANTNGDNSEDWPALNAGVQHVKKPSSELLSVRRKKKKNRPSTDSAKEKEGCCANGDGSEVNQRQNGPRGKKIWTRLDLSEKEASTRGGRSVNERKRDVGNSRKNENFGSNGFASQHSYSKGRGSRGRGGGYSHRRSQRNEASVSLEETVETKSALHNVATNELPPKVEIFSAPHATTTENIILTDIKNKIRNQIEYYFSPENLKKDVYLRRSMDSLGYVPLTLIAGFHKVVESTKKLQFILKSVKESSKLEASDDMTNNMQVILESVKESSKLEVSDDMKVRPVIDPLFWPLKDDSFPTKPGVPEYGPEQIYANVEPIVAQFNNLHLDQNPCPFYFPSGTDITTQYACSNAYMNEMTTCYPVNAAPPELEPSGSTESNPINRCGYYSDLRRMYEVEGYNFNSHLISNNLIYYEHDELSNGGDCYRISSPTEILNNKDSADNEHLDNNSPEPSR